jgi:uncharacterized protein YecE (DUF72 family)
MPQEQLALFDDADGVDPAAADPLARRLAEALSPRIRLGTSSWSFPGWTGLVYAPRNGRQPTERDLARAGLPAYAAQPLFRTVSLDRTFYAPLSRDAFAAYAGQVPVGFRFVVKAPAAITDPVIRRSGSGEPARANPSFLDATAAAVAFVQPAVAGLGAAAGPLVFQFPPLGRVLLADVPGLAARIGSFLAALPRGPVYAVEVRDPELVGPHLATAVAAAGAVPCLAVHARMPPVEEQAEAFGLARALDGRADGQSNRQAGGTPLVARWNLHAGKIYEQAKADYFPFDRLVDEDPASRLALARLVRLAAAADRDAFVTINNKAEGSGPLSVLRLAEAIVAARPAGVLPW